MCDNKKGLLPRPCAGVFFPLTKKDIGFALAPFWGIYGMQRRPENWGSAVTDTKDSTRPRAGFFLGWAGPAGRIPREVKASKLREVRRALGRVTDAAAAPASWSKAFIGGSRADSPVRTAQPSPCP